MRERWQGFCTQRLPVIRTRWLAALPIIVVSLILLFGLWGIFGVKYVSMAAFLTLLFRTRHKQDFRPRDLVRAGATMVLVDLAAFMAGRGLWWALGMNLVVPFVLVYLLSSKFSPKAYFVFSMEFVFLQLMPIAPEDLPTQLLALCCGLGVVTVALWLYARIIRRRRHYGTVRKGMRNLGLQFRTLACGGDVSAQRAALAPMIVHMNQVIYDSRGYTYLANGYGKIYYLFMVLFQRCSYFSQHFVRLGTLPPSGDRMFFARLSQVFAQAETDLGGENHGQLRQRVEELRRGPGPSDPAQYEAMGEILRLFAIALQAMEDTSPAQPQRKWKLPPDQHKLRGLGNLFRLDQFSTRFALSLSTVLCLGFGFVWLTGWEHAYWYPMTSFLMLMPYAEESRMKIGNRILGTMGGVVVSMCLMSLFHTMPEYLAILTVMTCFMYYAPVTSWTMTVYTTCYGMTLAHLRLGLMQASGLRLAYVALAAVTATLANRFLLPNTAGREFRQSVKELFDLDRSFLQQVRALCQKGGQDGSEMTDRLVRIHLLEDQIQAHWKGMSGPEQTYYRQLLPINRKLVSELEQINAYLRSRPQLLGTGYSRTAAEVLDNLEDAILRVQRSYTAQELEPFLQTDDSFRTFGRLQDSLYFNTLAVNCMQTLREMNELAAQPRT
ncbi:FUSC family protein [Pseudoflavonifractor sp. An85]|uniref:FUSC family protein n=1 Tax=Pseudoflavonifractor sp. An85 TaxID=1965661 RepID=UPI000B36F8D8|nr:FUSC family protein [Pseudoflavonifractor sp. An85]OUN18959.1 hypothetical protein B5G37_13825 [Pseudoflavonifractor sp. An85]